MQVFKLLRSGGPFADYPLYAELCKHQILGANEAVFACEDTVPFAVAKNFAIKSGIIEKDLFDDPESLKFFVERFKEPNMIVVDMTTFSVFFEGIETDFIRVDSADIPAVWAEWIKSKSCQNESR